MLNSITTSLPMQVPSNYDVNLTQSAHIIFYENKQRDFHINYIDENKFFEKKLKHFIFELQEKFDFHINDIAIYKLLSKLTEEENIQIKKAMRKSSYLKRLFSNESWSQWLEDKTEFGRLMQVFFNYLDSLSEDAKPFIIFIQPDDMRKANTQVTELLDKVCHDVEDHNKLNKPNVLSKMWNMLVLIDRKISSYLIPFSQASAQASQASAQKNTDDLQAKGCVQIGMAFSNNLAMIVNGESLDQSHMVKVAGEVAVTAMGYCDADEQARKTKDIHAEHWKTYREKLQKRDGIGVKCPKDGVCYFHENINCEPQLYEVFVDGLDMLTKKKICVSHWVAKPGYLHWSFYQSNYLKDTWIAGDSYNYSPTAGSLVPIVKGDENRFFCTP